MTICKVWFGTNTQHAGPVGLYSDSEGLHWDNMVFNKLWACSFMVFYIRRRILNSILDEKNSSTIVQEARIPDHHDWAHPYVLTLFIIHLGTFFLCVHLFVFKSEFSFLLWLISDIMSEQKLDLFHPVINHL